LRALPDYGSAVPAGVIGRSHSPALITAVASESLEDAAFARLLAFVRPTGWLIGFSFWPLPPSTIIRLVRITHDLGDQHPAERIRSYRGGISMRFPGAEAILGPSVHYVECAGACGGWVHCWIASVGWGKLAPRGPRVHVALLRAYCNVPPAGVVQFSMWLPVLDSHMCDSGSDDDSP
jgi:hypothetical protein